MPTLKRSGGAGLPPTKPAGPTPWTGQDAQIYNQIHNDPAQWQAWLKYRQQYPNRSLVGWDQRGRPGYAKPAAPAAPSPGQSGGAAPDNPALHDPIYVAAVARLNFDQSQGLKGLDVQDTQASEAHSAALQNLLTNRQYGIRNTQRDSNRRGVLYSTQHDNAISEGQAAYDAQVAGENRNYYADQKARDIARESLLQGLPLDTAAALAEAGGRIGTAGVNDATTGLPVASAGGSAASGGGALSTAEWKRRYNVLANKYGVNSPQVAGYIRRNPVPKSIGGG